MSETVPRLPLTLNIPAFTLLLICVLGWTGPTVAQTITVKNGGSIEVTNSGTWDLEGSTVDLGDVGSTVQIQETSGGQFFDGQLTATRDLNAPSQANPAGLGAEISSGENLGTTTITRGHAIQTGGGNSSIERYFEISPTNNSSLDATLNFQYTDDELNGLPESELVFFRSTDGGSNWTKKGQDGISTSDNRVTLNGISAFSRWTLASESSPLPVEFAGFEGQIEESDVLLSWRTASEQNNAGFAVQRKSQTGSWKRLGFVESKASGGTTSEPQTYRFRNSDLPFEADSLVYRLKQVDLDGTISFTDPTVVQRTTPNELKLLGTAPNPARTQTQVRFALPEDTGSKVQMKLYDVMGRKVRTIQISAGEGRHKRRLDVQSLASGIYFLRFQATGKIETQKVTVVR